MRFQPLFSDTPAWIFPSASVDLDFVNQRYFIQGLGNSLAPFTFTRASTAYMDDLSGNWVAFPSGALRLSNKGTLIEEARTNSIRNNSMQGAVAGTPGTAPTNWGFNANAGIAETTVVGTGVVNGINYIDVTIAGTANSSSTSSIQMELSQTIAALQNQVWSGSVFLSVVGGSTANLTDLYFDINEQNSSGGFLNSNHAVSVLSSINSTLTRYAGTSTLSQATTAFIYPTLNLQFSNAAVINITLRIGWPQLELGLFQTSPIRTTTVASTRAADLFISNALPAFSSTWSSLAIINPNGISNDTAGSRTFSSLTTASAFTTQHWIWNNSPTVFSATTGGVNATLTFSSTPFADIKSAITQSGATDFAACINNGTVATASSGTALTPTNLYIGSFGSGGGYANGYIKRLALWPVRLPNALLQAYTT